ncbi:MAG: hypothetical protein JW888_17110 [Pirellulales bacterium]|nr:hypothetical protein [Pirellulales bacterium]
MVRAIRRVNGCPDSVARELLARRSPVVVNPDLSYHDALLGQFEFICCDAITVIIPTEVVTDDERSYLDELYAMLRRSDEFEEVTLRVDGVPRSEDGIRFLDQFLGIVEPEIGRFPMDLRMLYKKARIMTHWGNRIGAQVRVTADSDQE